jgi:hypothetical protein
MATELIVSAFNADITMTASGTLATSSVAAISSDADAVLTVSLSDMRDMFQFQTDSADVLNADATDIKYYLDKSKFPTLNAANAMMDHLGAANPIASGLDANKMMIAHDFTRYLANELFGTYHGVDLFNNEVALLQDLRTLSGSGTGNVMGDIDTLLTAVDSTSGTDAGLATDGNSLKYLTNATSGNANICKSIFEQLTANVPSRFSAISASDAKQALPFVEDDVISFKLSITPATGQENLTSVGVITARSYKIKLLLKTTVANTAVDASEE